MSYPSILVSFPLGFGLRMGQQSNYTRNPFHEEGFRGAEILLDPSVNERSGMEGCYGFNF
jgi:hypothetical protein